MKRMLMTATLLVFAGSAYAGGGCDYGEHAKFDKEGAELAASTVENDPLLLGKNQAEVEAEALEKLIETPVIHN